jgi:UDP-glucose 4-epimerase
MKYKSFLILGGCGFVGSHVVDVLVEKGAEKIVVVDNLFLGKMENLSWARKNGNVIVYREDARYLSALENIQKTEKCDVAINLAVKCLPYGFIDPEGAYMTGVEIALNLANLMRKNCFSRLLHFSSSEAYGTAQKIPMSESHPLHPTSPYGAGKAAADLLLQSYHELFGLEVAIIRPFNMYGPRQNMDAYAAVIPLTIKNILSGQPPVLEGDGEQTRDFSFVKDVAEASLNLLECNKALGQVVNVGYGKEIKIKDVITKICDIMNFPRHNILHKTARVADVRRLCSSTKLAKKLINYAPKTDFDEGLRNTIEWFKITHTQEPCFV